MTNQLWLRAAVVDPRTRTFLHRLPQEPLPPNLRVPQLRSYLEQRFGPPVAEHVPGQAWMEFENPAATEETPGSHLLAMPLIKDPSIGELVPVFEKLEQFADLAAALGASRKGGRPLTAAEVWVGPLFNHSHLKYAVHDFAARASTAWLMVRGLEAEIATLRSLAAKGRIPAPGLAHLVKDTRDALDTASGSSNMAETYAARLEALTAEFAETHSSETLDTIRAEEQRLGMQHNHAIQPANRAEHRARDLAQLALGISAHLPSTYEVERIDRVCTAILHPPPGTGSAVPLYQDDLTVRAASRRELVVELAGVICRLLLDRRSVAWLMVGEDCDQVLCLQIEPGDTLLALADVSQGKPRKALLKSGWREQGAELLERRWPSPVSVLDPAGEVVKVLFGVLELGSLDRLNTSVTRTETALAPPEAEVEPQAQGGVM